MTRFKVGDRIRRTYRDKWFGIERTVLDIHHLHGHAVIAAPEDPTCTNYTISDVYWELIEEPPIMNERKFDPTKLSTERAFDATQPVQTRDGRKARIVCTDYKSRGPLLTLILDRDGATETCVSTMADGQNAYGCSSYDLVNVPEKRWINLYQDGVGESYFKSKEMAESSMRITAIITRRTYVKTIEVTLDT